MKTIQHIHRRALLTALAGLSALALIGCASRPELTRLQDPNADFGAYHSFAFMPTRPDGRNTLIEKRLLSAARIQLERRGYVYDELAPDVLVNMAAVVEERQGLRATAGGLPGSETLATEDYRLGRLAIDLIDVNRQDVVWHGTAEGRLSEAMLRDAGRAAETAVAAVFEGFPVKPLRKPAATSAPATR
jgi:hypothetical protein